VFAENGVPLIKANTARITGWAQVRDRLIGIDGDALLLFTENCKFTRDYLPALGRNKNNREDAEDEGEATHSADCVRYACASRPFTVDKKEPPCTDPVFGARITPAVILKQLKKQSGGERYHRRGRNA